MNALIELTAVWMQSPGRNATPEQVAAWYQAKGEMHERLASQPGMDTVTEMSYATAAYDHARRLLGGTR